jgi:hypothetical protein
MKTFVKIEGDPKDKAIERLRKIAIAMPRICVYDTILEERIQAGELGGYGIPGAGGGGQIEDSIDMVMDYFGGPDEITKERCATIVSTSVDLGNYDFAYEWTSKPSTDQVKRLEKDIKTTLDPLKLKYSIKSE